MNIYYVTDQLGYWINPLHSYFRNWFINKDDAENRKYTFEHLFIFNNTKYTVQTLDVPVEIEENKEYLHSEIVTKLILENTTSNAKAKMLMLESGVEYADIDKILYYFNRRNENLDTSHIPNFKPKIATADNLKEFIVDMIQTYEQAYFNNLIDDFFGVRK